MKKIEKEKGSKNTFSKKAYESWTLKCRITSIDITAWIYKVNVAEFWRLCAHVQILQLTQREKIPSLFSNYNPFNSTFYLFSFLSEANGISVGLKKRNLFFSSDHIFLSWQLEKKLILISLSLHWENYISFQIEWDIIVVTVFLSILNQMEFNLV